jgi:isopentenyl phosphate kinase
LDAAILKALGLDPNIYLEALYDGLTGLVRERIDLARVRKKIRQSRIFRNIEKLKDSVLEEILPNGIKVFPEGFVDSKALMNVLEISISPHPLRMGDFFFGKQEIVAEDSYRYEAASIDMAKFIIYAQKKDSLIVKIPKGHAVISRAVEKYEKYILQIREKLYSSTYQRTLDHKLSASATSQMMTSLGIPQL